MSSTLAIAYHSGYGHTRNDINWLAGSGGALAQSPSDASPEEGPLPGDLETARVFGARIAGKTAQLVRGRA